MACGWHAVSLAKRALHVPLAEARCLAIGGGAIGLGAALALAARGAREIWLAETSPERRAVVEKAGDFRVFDPTQGDGPGRIRCSIVIDGVGIAPTRAAASRLVRRGGVIVHIGLGSCRGRARYPPYHAAGNHLLSGPTPTPRRISARPRGDVRRPPRRAGLDRDAPAVRGRNGLRDDPGKARSPRPRSY
jgi:D-arabinose 1-dehydrogenase-like Zn-dependent alcohol dehydrogenase